MRERGSILLNAAIVIFLLSLAASAAATYWFKWRMSDVPVVPETKNSAPTDLSLEPLFEVRDLSAEEEEELRKNLYDPLRQYYVTQKQRLVSVKVEPTADIEHSFEVVVSLQSGEGSEDKVFFYDREGEDLDGGFPEWNLEMYDNTQ